MISESIGEEEASMDENKLNKVEENEKNNYVYLSFSLFIFNYYYFEFKNEDII